MDFQEPDEKTIAQMTIESTQALLDGLVQKRNALVAPHDEQIEFYQAILDRKKEELINRSQQKLIGKQDA